MARNPRRLFQYLAPCRFKRHAAGHCDPNPGISLDTDSEMFGAGVPDETNFAYFSKVQVNFFFT